jgi:hypothetical protein
MTDKTSLTNLTRDYATGDSPQAHRVPERPRCTEVMKHFWPALVVPPMLIPRPEPAPESYARRRR